MQFDRRPIETERTSDSQVRIDQPRGERDRVIIRGLTHRGTEMHPSLFGWTEPTEKEFEELWSSGLIILDANVLLNLLRYSAETRDWVFECLVHVEDRLWLPHQAALEYLRNRHTVSFNQERTLAEAERILEATTKQLKDKLRPLDRHHLVSMSEVLRPISEAVNESIEYMQRTAGSSPGSPSQTREYVSTRLRQLYAGRVGEPLIGAEADTAREEAERRIKLSIPPGYKDSRKGGDGAHGDYVLWRQVLKHCAQEGRHAIVVTDDRKEDWWRLVAGRTIGPRPELVQEFYAETSKLAWLYRPHAFLRRLCDFAAQAPDVDLRALEEVKAESDLDRASLESIRDEIRSEKAREERLFEVAHANELRTALEVANAEQALAKRQNNVRRLHAEVLEAEYRLERATGTVPPDDDSTSEKIVGLGYVVAQLRRQLAAAQKDEDAAATGLTNAKQVHKSARSEAALARLSKESTQGPAFIRTHPVHTVVSSIHEVE